MTSLAQRASARLGVWIAAAAGQSVKYRRGAADVELTAAPGRPLSEDYGADGSAVTADLRDWIVDPADVVIESVTVRPQLGDLIITEDGATFAVVYADGEHCWRYTDQFRQRIRVHTVEQRPTGEDE